MNLKKIKVAFMVFILGLSLASCTDNSNKLDYSSNKNFLKSIDKVKKNMSEEDKNKFEGILIKRGMQIAFRQAFLGGEMNKNDVSTAIRNSFKGKSVEEILKEEKTGSDKKEEPKEVPQKNSKVEKIKVVDSKLSKSKVGFLERYSLHLELTNNTDESLSRIYFKGKLVSPDRKVPWLVEEFNYEIPGGMEPGESKTLDLAPYGWTDIDIPKDGVFNVEVIKAENHLEEEI